MGLFRKKMKLNEIYKGIIMDMVQPEAQTWVVEILFPDFKSTAMRNRPKDAMDEKKFDKRDFETFLYAMVISSVASLASWVHPDKFCFFDEVISDEALKDAFHDLLDLEDYGQGLIEFLNTGNKQNIVEHIKSGSEIYGRKSTMQFDQAEMFETASITLSYMIEYFSKNSPEIERSLNVNQASSRDSLIDFYAYVVRYWNNVLKNIKPDLS